MSAPGPFCVHKSGKEIPECGQGHTQIWLQGACKCLTSRYHGHPQIAFKGILRRAGLCVYVRQRVHPHRGRFQLVLAVPPKDMAYPGEIPGDIPRPGWSVAAAWSEALRFGSAGAVQIRAGIEELFRGLRAQGIRYLIKCTTFDKILRILLAAHHIAQLGYIGIFLYKISKFLTFYADIYHKLTRFDKVSIDILDYQ